MNDEETYWDELGVAWRATESSLEQAFPLLQTRLRRQSLIIAAGLTLGIPLCIVGIALGAYTLWRGWTTGPWNFVARGFAIAIISTLLLRALASFLPLNARIAAQSLSAMLDIASAQTRRTMFLLRMAIAGCAIAAVFGLVGAVIRTHAGSPPRISPIIDLIVLALIVGLLCLFERTVSAKNRKLQYLRRTLGAD